MENMSLREKKIAELQRQGTELKKSLLGRKNGSAVNEVPLIRRTMAMQRVKVKKDMKMQKVSSMRKRQKEMKNPLSKVSIKHFY